MHHVDEPLRLRAGEKFSGHHPIKVLNRDNAEIDDIRVIRDGDHLFLAEEDDHCV